MHYKLDKKKFLLTIIIFLLFGYFSLYSPFEGEDEEIEVLYDEFYEPKFLDEDTSNYEEKAFKSIDLVDYNLELKEYKEEFSKRLSKLVGDTFKIKYTNDVLYAEIFESDKLKGLYFENFYNNTIKGYAGPIYIGIFTNVDSKISSVSYIVSSETESYLLDIRNSGFYQQFENLDLTKKNEIDAVSGATLTSQAISKSVTEIVNRNNKIIDSYLTHRTSDFEVIANLNKIWIIHISIIGILFSIFMFKKIGKTKKIRLLTSIFTLLYLGFFLNNSFTYVSFINPLLGFSMSAYIAIYSLFVILGAIWGGNTYCKFICPFGTAQLLLIKISPFKKKKLFLSSKQISYIRYSITMILFVGIFAGMNKWKNYELFPDLFSLNFSNIYLYVSLLFLIVSMRYPMLWCRLSCPTGCVLDAISKISKNKK